MKKAVAPILSPLLKRFALARYALPCAVLASLLGVAAVSALADDGHEVTATVDAFHDALRRGDGAAALKLLAPDALIIEGGATETRAEYESHHLAADMEFAKAVPSTRSNVKVGVNGDTAWLSSASRTEGTFKDRPINSRGAELMVLTKTPDGWRIRAIHWSSQKVTKPE